MATEEEEENQKLKTTPQGGSLNAGNGFRNELDGGMCSSDVLSKASVRGLGRWVRLLVYEIRLMAIE